MISEDYDDYYVRAVAREMGRGAEGNIEKAMDLAMVPDSFKSKIKKMFLQESLNIGSGKYSQLDTTTCSICGKSKNRDQMANSEICLDCEDKEKIKNGQ